MEDAQINFDEKAQVEWLHRVPIPSFIVDEHTGKALFANNAFFNQFGYDQSDLSALNASALHPNSFIELLQQKDVETQQTKDNLFHPSVPCLCKDGSVIFCDLMLNRIRFGYRTAMLGMFINRSEEYSLAFANRELTITNSTFFALPPAKCIIDHSLNIITTNSYFDTVFRSSEASDPETSILKFIEENHRAAFYRFISDTISMSAPPAATSAFIALDAFGQMLNVEVLSAPIPGLQKVIVSIQSITAASSSRDPFLTRSSPFSRYLNHSEYVTYRLHFSDAGDSIIIPYVSPNIENVLGYTPEELINAGPKLSELIHPEDVHYLYSVSGLKSLTDNVITRQIRIRHKQSGEFVLAEDTIIPMVGRDGRTIGYSGILRRIAPTHSNKSYKGAFDTILGLSDEAIMILNQNGTIEFINHTYERLFGYHSVDLIGKSIHMLRNDKNHSSLYDTVWNKIYSGRSTTITLKAQHASGEFFDIECRFHPLPSGDSPCSLIVIFIRDLRPLIASRKAQSDHVEEVNQLINHLLVKRDKERYSLSESIHDKIGQQLAFIQMGLESLRGNTQDRDTVKRLDALLRAASSGLMESRNILNKLTSMTTVQHDLRTILLVECEEFQNLTDIRTTCTIAGDAGEIPHQHKQPLFDIIKEVMTNTARHSRARNLMIELTIAPDQLVLTIRDDGAGFIVGDVVRAVNNFGMLFIRERVRHLGGTYSVQSSPGNGTAFLLTVPFGPTAMGTTPSAAH